MSRIFRLLSLALSIAGVACGSDPVADQPAPGNDASTSPDATLPDGGSPPPRGEGLTVSGNAILGPDGKPFHGRGANLHDTRSCNACTAQDPDVPGVKRWADELIDNWHANFIRFLLEAYASSDGYRKQWKSLASDDAYLAQIKEQVTHIASKPGVYVMVTLMEDPSIKGNNGDFDSEWPTDAAMPIYEKLAETFHDQPRVLFGLTNEPHGPADRNDELRARYVKAIDTIRAVEAKHGSPKHIVVVQAPQGWARDLAYFVDKPLEGENIAYEVHIYNPEADFDKLVTQPKKKLPMLIGEHAPADTYMTEADVRALWTLAQRLEIPHIAWNFHQRCPPNMLVDNASDGCGLGISTGYAFPRTAWGNTMHDYLAKPW